MATLLTARSPRTWGLVVDRGEDLVAVLRWFALDEEVDAATFSATGTLSACVLGTLDGATGVCRQVPVDDHVDVLSLHGHIAVDERRRPVVDARLVVSRPDATLAGGRLVTATADPSVEVLVTDTPAHLARCIDGPTGLSRLLHLHGTASRGPVRHRTRPSSHGRS